MKNPTAFALVAALAAALIAAPAASFAQNSMSGGAQDQSKGPNVKNAPHNPSSRTDKTGETAKDKAHNDKDKMTK